MFPIDARTISYTTSNPGTYTLWASTSSPITIIHGTISDSDTSSKGLTVSRIYITGVGEIDNLNGNFNDTWMHLVVTSHSIQAIKTGTASTTFGFTYVPRDRNVTLDPYPYPVASSTISGTTTSTYMDATTTTMYQNTMNMEAMAFTVILWLVTVYSVYWLIRKLF